jgi:glycosyltransferase involved in cell wall biosynthesis
MNRIGLLYPRINPASPANWSGIPRGLFDGLLSNGLEVIPIPCHLPEWLRLPVALLARAGGARGNVAHHQLIYAWGRSIAIASAIRRASALDGIVAMGTDHYDLRRALKMSSLPVATYDDGTFELFLRYRDSELYRSGYPVEKVKQWAERQGAACRFANVACVSTEWAKRSVVEDFGVPEQKVRVVGMGHRPRSVRANQRRFESPRFLFVGVDWKRKNGAAVIAAFAQVRQCCGQAHLDIVGEHPPLNQAGVTGHGFLPWDNVAAQEQLDQLFARATAFVLPSLFEPAGIAYLEAASTGLPVIATTRGGAAELLSDGAIAVDPYDHEALVRAMLYFADKDNAQSMGARAKVLAAKSTWRAVGGRILEALQEDVADANRTTGLHQRAR